MITSSAAPDSILLSCSECKMEHLYCKSDFHRGYRFQCPLPNGNYLLIPFYWVLCKSATQPRHNFHVDSGLASFEAKQLPLDFLQAFGPYSDRPE